MTSPPPLASSRPPPTSPTTFADLGVPAPLARALARAGVTAPFPIQAATLPDSLAGRDLAGRAPTGSGKTLAFCLPVAARAGAGAPHRPRALILVPTRELAAQVTTVLAPLAAAAGRSVASVYGGTNINRDVATLRRGVDIVVACPGRLADLVRRGSARLDDVHVVVIDEADRMADMGFLPEVTRLLDRTATDRQTLLFSATLDGDVDVLVRRYQRSPRRHEVATPRDQRGEVRHAFYPADKADKRRLVAAVVRGRGPAIVFTRTKHGADRLAKQLAADGLTTAAIHGNRTQPQREKALARFAAGQVAVLIATDVAARGIHVDDVPLVVHHDLPPTGKDYLHRSGRTGRAGADGLVVAFVTDDQHDDLAAIQRAVDLPVGLTVGTLADVDTAAVAADPAHGSRRRPARRNADAPSRTQGRRRQRTQS